MISGDFVLACGSAAGILLLPGFALASLLVPKWKWWERLAMAPGLSTGMVGVTGVFFHDLRIPFTPLSVLPLLAAITLAGAVDQWRRHRRGDRPARDSKERIAVGLALGAGLITVAIFLFGVRHEPVPVYDDPAIHGAVASAIQRTHDVLPVIPNPQTHTGFVRPRTAIESTAALAGWAAHLPATALLLPMGLVAAALFGLGLVQVAREWTDSWAAAALAPVLAIGTALPTWPLLFGEYPLLVDSTLVPCMIVGTLHLMRGQQIRRTGMLVFAATASIWIGHGLEALTAAAVGGALVTTALLEPLGSRSRRAAAIGLLVAMACAAAGALMVTALTHLPPVAPALTLQVAGVPLQTIHLSPKASQPGLLAMAIPIILVALPSLPMVVPYAAGVLYAVVRWRLAGLVVTHLALVLAYYDVSTGLLLGRLWRAVYPWAVSDRLLGTEYWVLPVILALGTVWLIAQARRLRLGAGASAVKRLAGSGVLALVLGFLVGGVCLALAFEFRTVVRQAADYGKVTTADLEVFRSMQWQLPAGAIVLTDGPNDAGIWLDALTPQVAYATYDADHPDDFHLVALEHACAQPGEAVKALADVQAVFVGSRHNIDAVHPWTVDCVSRLPGLRLLSRADSGGRTAAAFAVIRP